jgi:hypothetical protein
MASAPRAGPGPCDAQPDVPVAETVGVVAKSHGMLFVALAVLTATPAAVAATVLPQEHVRLHRGRAIGVERAQICTNALHHFCNLTVVQDGGCHQCLGENAAALQQAGCRTSEQRQFCAGADAAGTVHREVPHAVSAPPPPPCNLPKKWQSFCPKPVVCSCADPSLCQSLPPGTGTTTWQNFAFHSDELCESCT